MNVIKSRFVYHLMAIITVAIWGTTFVSRYHISLQRVSDSMHITCSDHTAFLFVQKKRTFHPPSCLRIDHGFDRSGAGCFQRQFHSEN